MTDTRNPPRCDTCGKHVRPWQRYGGVGPVGFTRRTAVMLWHSRCAIERAEGEAVTVKRRWFAEMNHDTGEPTGRYFRNCPLIMSEQEEAIRHFRPRLARKLAQEWDQCFRGGVIYTDRLGPRDVVVRAQDDDLSDREWGAKLIASHRSARP